MEGALPGVEKRAVVSAAVKGVSSNLLDGSPVRIEGPARSKVELAHEYIRTRIADGTFKPGHRLVLAQLASEVGISVVPIREALRMLESEQLVTYTRNVGAQVALLDRGVYAHTMETLGLIEGYATALSAPLLTEAALRHARTLNEQMRALVDELDPERFTRLNTEFHRVLFGRCPNPHISALVERGWERLAQLRESTFSFVPARAAVSVAEHDRLLDLIEERAPMTEIECCARQHRHATMHALMDG